MLRFFANIFFLSLLIPGCTFIEEGSILSEPEGHYVGVMVDGVRQGQGRYTFQDDQFYQGEFDQGNFHGNGRFQYVNGDHYDGEWVNNQREGKGIYRFGSGSQYSGSWRKDKQEGQGTLSEKNGNYYQGEWVNGRQEGVGVKHYADGRRYQGAFQQGTYSGQGFFTTPDGRRYTGQWVNGKRSGEGEFIYSNGDRYQGRWQDNKLNGLGRYEFVSNQYYEGQFHQGQVEGAGKLVDPNRFEYVGEFHNNQFHGYGQLVFTDGAMYLGAFNGGVFNGPGVFYFKDGGQYRGEWENGVPEGYGRYQQSNQVSFSGRWQKGTLVNKPDKIVLKVPGKIQGITNLASTNLDAWVLAATGVGVFISPVGHLLTTQNVAKGCEQITFSKQGAHFVARIRAEDLSTNLALLTAMISPEVSLALNHKDIFIMKELWAGQVSARMQGESKISLESVIVTAVNGVKNKVTELQIEGDFEKIQGGSPVVDNNGRLTALLEDKRALEKGSEFWRPVPTNTHFAIKVQAIEQFLKNETVSLPLGNDSIKSDSDLKVLVLGSTVNLSCWMSESQIEEFKAIKVLFNEALISKTSP